MLSTRNALRGRRTTALVALGLIFALAAPLTTSAATFEPAGIVTGTSAIEWDPASDRVFATTWQTRRVEVYRMNGTRIDSIEMGGIGSSLDLVGDILYVGLPFERSIAKIDLSTSSVLGYLRLGYREPWRIAVVGDRVWFADEIMYSVAIDDETDVDQYLGETGVFPNNASLLAVPGQPSKLLAWASDDAAGRVYVYETANEPIVLEGVYEVPDRYLTALTLSPDGGRFFYAAELYPDVPGRVTEVRLSDLKDIHTYRVPGDQPIDAIAVDGARNVAFARSYPAGKIWVFPHLAKRPVRDIVVGPTCRGNDVEPGGLAFTASGDLAALESLETFSFVTYPDPLTAVKTSSLSLTPSSGKGAPGDLLTFSGVFGVTSGRISDRRIDVWLSDQPQATLAHQLRTDESGTFSFDAVASTRSLCYTARFAGTPTMDPSSAVARVDVARLPTTVTITSVAPERIAPSESFTIQGVVTVGDGADQQGRDLILERRNTDTNRNTRIPFEAGPGGTFSITDTPTQEGRHEYGVIASEIERYERGYDRAPSVLVKKWDPQVTLTVSDPKVIFGETVQLTMQIPADATARTVKVIRWEGHDRTTAFRGEVGRHGRVTIDVTPRRNTVFEGIYGGEPRYDPGRDEVEILVRPFVGLRLLDANGTDGDYKLYRADGRVYIGAWISPTDATNRLFFTVQRRAGGRWKLWGQGEGRLGDDGVVVVFIERNAFPVGARCRVIAVNGETTRYLAGHSEWRYFRII